MGFEIAVSMRSAFPDRAESAGLGLLTLATGSNAPVAHMTPCARSCTHYPI